MLPLLSPALQKKLQVEKKNAAFIWLTNMHHKHLRLTQQAYKNYDSTTQIPLFFMTKCLCLKKKICKITLVFGVFDPHYSKNLKFFKDFFLNKIFKLHNFTRGGKNQPHQKEQKKKKIRFKLQGRNP